MSHPKPGPTRPQCPAPGPPPHPPRLYPAHHPIPQPARPRSTRPATLPSHPARAKNGGTAAECSVVEAAWRRRYGGVEAARGRRAGGVKAECSSVGAVWQRRGGSVEAAWRQRGGGVEAECSGVGGAWGRRGGSLGAAWGCVGPAYSCVGRRGATSERLKDVHIVVCSCRCVSGLFLYLSMSGVSLSARFGSCAGTYLCPWCSTYFCPCRE